MCTGPGSEMPAVVIVDDHLLLVETVQQGLRRRGIDAAIVVPHDDSPNSIAPISTAPISTASSRGSAGVEPTEGLLDRILSQTPALVLLDLDLGPAGPSTPLIAPLVAAGIRVVMVTGVVDRLRIAEALEQGAIGYQPKAAGFDALVGAACTALETGGPLDPAGNAALRAELRDARTIENRELAPFRRLTEREQQTLRALGDGQGVREIADDWVVSEATVRSHVRSILTKLGATSQLQAVAKAARRGWFSVASGSGGPVSGPPAPQRGADR